VTVDLTSANSYFATHLDKITWTAATDDAKVGALTTAEMEISTLPINLNSAQTQSKIVIAVYEQAVWRLRSNSKREDLQAQGVKSVRNPSGVAESYGILTYGIPLAPRAKAVLNGCWAIGAIR
jgi:osmotically-inducible protein OsmY